MTSLTIPTPPVADRRPLSAHGMPKPPKVVSSDRPHRFSGLGFSRDSFANDRTSPITPGPFSPPMSARSFSTMIDSEPSTPAYSPRMEYDWDHSTLVLLRPLSSSSEPPSPSEPAWDMMSPVHISQRNNNRALVRSKASTVAVDRKPKEFKLSSPPLKQSKLSTKEKIEQSPNLSTSPQLSQSPKPSQSPSLSQSPRPSQSPLPEQPAQATQSPQSDQTTTIVIQPKEEHKPVRVDSKELTAKEEKPPETPSDPLGKLASKMKSMLRRRSATESQREKKKKKTDYYDVDRMEDVHWTEM